MGEEKAPRFIGLMDSHESCISAVCDEQINQFSTVSGFIDIIDGTSPAIITGVGIGSGLKQKSDDFEAWSICHASFMEARIVVAISPIYVSARRNKCFDDFGVSMENGRQERRAETPTTILYIWNSAVLQEQSDDLKLGLIGQLAHPGLVTSRNVKCSEAATVVDLLGVRTCLEQESDHFRVTPRCCYHQRSEIFRSGGINIVISNESADILHVPIP